MQKDSKEEILKAIFYLEQDIKELKEELESKQWELNFLKSRLNDNEKK